MKNSTQGKSKIKIKKSAKIATRLWEKSGGDSIINWHLKTEGKTSGKDFPELEKTKTFLSRISSELDEITGATFVRLTIKKMPT